MMVSPFFQQLRSAYQAELDDLAFDSEGGNVLRQRLADKRREIGFLVHMMELSPEMVAVVFHQGLKFRLPGVMEHLLSHEADEFPEWHSLADAIELAPWAQDLADVVLKQPQGEWFMTVVAGLEYMAGRPQAAGMAQDGRSTDGDEDDEDIDNDQDAFDDEAEDGDGPGDARARREAGDDWMVEQGFDRKD
ncbi:MAG: hypothetical protein JWP47_310 [Polaromonas sp.]|jgi:hypothetical protein|nr:hypothetical protein [Polaromonas sp.]